jgi:hypothetical protein
LRLKASEVEHRTLRSALRGVICSETRQQLAPDPITHEIPGPLRIMAGTGAPKKLCVSTIIDS